MENTLKYLNVGSKKMRLNQHSIVKCQIVGQPSQKAQDSLKGKDLQPVIIGNGNTIKAQSTRANTKLLPNSKVLAVTDGDITMPNMKGWTTDDVLAFQELTGINVTTKGSGYVTKHPEARVNTKSIIKRNRIIY